MKKSGSSSSEGASKQNEYSFSIDRERTLQISSAFEGGNISLVKQIHELYYILEPVADIEGLPSRKSWFYFRMRAQRGIKVRLILQNVHIYQSIFEEKGNCPPFCREGAAPWLPMADTFLTFRDEIVLVIDYTFRSAEDVYVCLSVPFTYADNESFLQELGSRVHENVSYSDEVLAVTPQGRNVRLLTITESAKRGKSAGEDRKPVVLVTARVHPGEVSSSFCLQGMLEFLLSYNNLQAYLLRRLFVFKIVPMLNPDGVCAGNYRMDPQGFNLNRFYSDPTKEQHQAVYAVSELMKSLSQKQKIEFYFDLHSHSSIKESFIYGNALDDIVHQTYSELFCKILEENYPRFRYGLSNFGEKQMKHRDRGEAKSKEGCGRVVINRLCGVIQSYTVESSIFETSYECFIAKSVKSEPKNKEFTYQPQGGKSSYEYESVFEPPTPGESLIVAENRRLGKSIMVSILDMVRKNPYSRLCEDFSEVFCREVSMKLLQTEERFKLMDIKAYHKSKNIMGFVRSWIEDKLDREWNVPSLLTEINAGNWPKEVRKVAIVEEPPRDKTNTKCIRVRTEGREKTVSQSLSKAKKSAKTPVEIKDENAHINSHRSISPKNRSVGQANLEIKYSIELKGKKGEGSEMKIAAVREMQFNETLSVAEEGRVKKKLIIDYIQEEMGKINPDKQLFKRSNASLNRLIAHKILEKEKAKNRNSQLNEYQQIAVESRKRIATQAKEPHRHDEGKVLKDRMSLDNDEELLKGLELRKAEMVKKRFLATNKAIEILKRSDRTKVKLPEVNKISLIVENGRGVVGDWSRD